MVGTESREERVDRVKALWAFEKKYTVSETGCWIWHGAKGGSNQKYGKMHFRGKVDYAHRISYMLFVGEIPTELEIDHLCRVTLCVNPDHLETVTHEENVARIPKPTHCPKGHPYDEQNTYHQAPTDGRKAAKTPTCRRCHADRQNARYHRLKAAKNV